MRSVFAYLALIAVASFAGRVGAAENPFELVQRVQQGGGVFGRMFAGLNAPQDTIVVQATTCYSIGSKTVNMRSAACGSTVVITIPANTVVQSTVSPTTVSSCSLGYNTWAQVSYSGRTGYIATGIVTTTTCSTTPPVTPPPTGSGWLTRAGSYTVENMDRRNRGYSSGPQSRGLTKFLLHTIEGAWPRYGDFEGGTSTLDGRGYWPHFIVAYDRSGRLRVGQYLPMGNYARALTTGNSDGVVQVEIGGKAESPFTSNDAGLTAAVRALYAAISSATGIPVRVDSRVRFVGSSGYGTGAAQRLSQSNFQSLTGLCGHQHVYSNSHWDPGAINPSALM